MSACAAAAPGKWLRGAVRQGIVFLITLCCVAGRSVAGEDYLSFCPPGAENGKPLPLLVCLPAVGISAREDLGHWVSPAVKHGFIVADLPVDYRLITTGDDVEALYQRIVRVVDEVGRAYPVDSTRIYLVGTSAGGMMAIALGLRYPGKFIAIGAASGAHLNFGADQMLKNARGVSFFLVHGTRDTIIPIELFASAQQALLENGAVVESNVREGEGHPVSPAGYEWLVAKLAENYGFAHGTGRGR